jgi:hypothetical protein
MVLRGQEMAKINTLAAPNAQKRAAIHIFVLCLSRSVTRFLVVSCGIILLNPYLGVNIGSLLGGFLAGGVKQ